MALLFADVVNKYNAEKNNNISDNELSNKVADFLDSIEVEDTCPQAQPYNIISPDDKMSPQRVFVASIANEYYSKAQEDIANTNVGNKCVRKKNFKQVMQESFFYGSNRFGNNFIA
jgi:hypothetical protein